jgi:hypothetical protein
MELSKRNTAEGTNDIYEVEVKRHVSIREWDELHSWIELRHFTNTRNSERKAGKSLLTLQENLGLTSTNFLSCGALRTSGREP